MRLLARLFGGLSEDERVRLEEGATEVHVGAAALEALRMSHGDLANALRAALKAAYPGERTYVWTRDVYDDAVVYEVETPDGTVLFQRSYALADGAVTLGEPVPVVAVTQYVPAAQVAGEITVPAPVAVTQVSAPVESAGVSEITGELVPLVEQAVATDGTVRLKLIQAGQGSSGYYPADVLKRDGPKVFTANTHMHLDHPSASEESDRPERSVTTLAGTLTSDARWEEAGPAGPGLYAEAKVRSDLAPLIEELAPHIGVSIRALGKAGTREIGGKRVRTIEAIEQAKSVDFVTIAGAGGLVLDLVESARKRAGAPKGDDDMSQEELAEARRKIAELEARETERLERDAERDRELARLRETNVLREAQAVVVEELARIQLPAPTRERLTAQLSANPPLVEGANDRVDREALAARVREAATAELDYLTKAVGSPSGIRGMGGEPPASPLAPDLAESEKRIAAALSGL